MPAYRVCWGIQLLVPPFGNLLTLKSLTFRTSFSVFHCLPALPISHAGEAITKTIPRDRRKLIKLMLRKCTFLPPHSHLIGQFVKWHLVTIQREQHVLAQWLRRYICPDHGVCSVQSTKLVSKWGVCLLDLPNAPLHQRGCYTVVPTKYSKCISKWWGVLCLEF